MYTTLIDPEQLANSLRHPQWVLVDCRFNLAEPGAGEGAYNQSHIPGAHYAHLDRDLSGARTATTGRHPLPDPARLAARFGEWGIGANTQVVAYDEGSGAFAARLWWLLRWMGHAAVAVLDGGFKAWTQHNLPVEHAPPQHLDAHFSPAASLCEPVDATFVAAMWNTDRDRLIDVRAAARFAGESEPIDKVAGHIPGALNIPFDRNLTERGTFRTPDQLRQLYSPQLPPQGAQRVVVMCGSGVTACHTLLALEHAGLHGARLYAGSWSEWITDPARPVATGTGA